MKKLLLTLLVAFSLSVEANDDPFTRCLAGLWYDPAKSGEGLILEVDRYEELAVSYFFTYEWQGEVVNQWLMLLPKSLPWDRNHPLEIDIYMPTGGDGNVVDIGDGMLSGKFWDFKLNFSYTLDPEYCIEGECEKSYEYRRLTNPLHCDDNA